MERLKDITVLITAAGNVFMPGTTNCIRNNQERNIRLVGADMNDDRTMLEMFDVYYPVPRGDDPNYVNVLLDICKKEKVDIILPIMSSELNALAKNRQKFESIGTKVSVSNLEQLEIANDKRKLFDFMRDNNIPCAMYSEVHNICELEDKVKEFGYPETPVCIKATKGSGSRGFRIIDESKSKFDAFMNDKPNSCCITLDELKSIFAGVEEFPELMVMEFLPGQEYTVDLLADKGKTIYNCCRKSLNMENSIMLDGMVVDNQDVKNICSLVTEKLNLDGNIGFDVKERADGTPVIMECNPRITAGIPVFAIAGVNLPYLNIKRLLGESLPDVVENTGLIVKRRWKEMYHL